MVPGKEEEGSDPSLGDNDVEDILHNKSLALLFLPGVFPECVTILPEPFGLKKKKGRIEWTSSDTGLQIWSIRCLTLASSRSCDLKSRSNSYALHAHLCLQCGEFSFSISF
mmetsp:Transcript_5881/g.7713  ORF Transcript_5881/g.7713 Transcript_5881/m.7713 type:complete len:111 (-) Transcript_5881:225-557(-)